MKEPFKSAIPVLELIEKAGFKAYFVGGSVRDYLLGFPINDIDIASSATPSEIKEIFPRTIDLGIEHGTVMVLYNTHSYEITTFRSESDYIDYRRPSSVTFIRSIEEDLARRDFTMNAVAMNRFGEILDPFGGKIDIEAKTIRTVGKASERFSEDALRMLRGIRFVSKLSFVLDPDTYQGIKDHKHLLSHIAVERIAAELDKLLSGAHTAQGIQLLIETDIHKYIPGLLDKKAALLQLSQLPIQSLSIDEKWALFSLFIQKGEKEVKQFFSGLRFSNKRVQQIVYLSKWLSERSKNNWSIESVYASGKETALQVEKVYQAYQRKVDSLAFDSLQKIIEALPIHSLADVKVSGSDLIEWKQKNAGPWVKDVLREIETEILHGRLDNNNEVIKEWVTKCSLN
ncbi:CCA tRNA nucleotidyltransferase [Robertmurraya korlensis]|uniref:CCA tRNA nucleotidyltransferase n=1 Tax=Robertmurraya korlensis TaxID=519977 RepID=UPI00203FAC3D|nr:CCA tRNA nucleotidyltransferase [Robertmurraya korlensis]MCM3599803.1 CCA tRNA nucleotidyltransferase [Robertmurraya korlensis]